MLIHDQIRRWFLAAFHRPDGSERMSLRQLSAASGVARSTLYRLVDKDGTAEVTQETLDAVADALGVRRPRIQPMLMLGDELAGDASGRAAGLEEAAELVGELARVLRERAHPPPAARDAVSEADEAEGVIQRLAQRDREARAAGAPDSNPPAAGGGRSEATG